MENAGYQKLNVYLKSHELAKAIYKITKKFPRDEMFGLVSQMRRSAVSVPANIVEGYGRRSAADKLQFYYIVRGSLNELEYCLELSKDLNYLTQLDYKRLCNLRDDAGKLLSGFTRSAQ